MSFLPFLRRPSKRGSSKKDVNKALLSFDLLYQLTYMSAVASTGLPRDRVFELAARLPSTVAHYFASVDNLVKSLRYRHADAFRVVGERATMPEIKSLFLRIASFLTTGEPEAIYLGQEAKLQADSYVNVYEGTLESLKKWTDAFAAIAVSSALIVVVATISTVIFELGTNFVLGLIFIMLMVNVGGVWVLWKSAPKEVKVLQGALGERSQKTPRTLFIVLMPLAGLIGMMMYAFGMDLPMILIALGLLVLPIGLAANRFDGFVGRQDQDISVFLRLLGSTASSIGVTTTEALSRIDMRTVATLAPAVRRLHVRLLSKVRKRLCWDRFVEETGSETVYRSVRIFTDGVDLGGDADEVGRRASVLASDIGVLRAKRAQIAQTFGWLTIVMHGAVVFLLMFVLEIVTGFGELVQGAGASSEVLSSAGAGAALTFSFGNIQLLQGIIVPVVIVLSFLNALAPKVTEGGYTHKLFYFLSLTLLTGGAASMFAPKVGDWIFAASQRT